MTLWTGKNRRWQPAAAIVAALSVFVALIAGSSLRPQFSAGALPEPAAWSHGAPDVGAHTAQHATHDVAEVHAPHSTPLDKKPFHSMWMTRDRPASWTRIAPQPPSPPAPASFAVSGFAPRVTHCGAPPNVPPDEDILARLCVARR